MRILLDTNVVIHRENKRVSNYSIGHLFRWIDKLKYDKVIHPYTISEIQKYRDPETQETISVKLESYDVIKTVRQPDTIFLSKIGQPEKNENDHIDNCLLYEVYLGRVDILITEDRRLRNKADHLGLSNCVFSINGFIAKVSAENPDLIEYKALSVEKVYFGNVDSTDSFFDSFRNSYTEFDRWFARKCDEEAYICRSDSNKILGFLYLKTEDVSENYSDIEPPFSPKRRLKVGTFKVESTGFRLGERFVKIIFDNAQQRNVDEIYVTLFTDRGELVALEELLYRWGFVYYGIKHNGGKEEKVLVKILHKIIDNGTPKLNYPNISHLCNKFILPIMPQYHTTLLPDSQLNSENRIDFLGREPHRYALQKVYISWASTNGAKPGDLILFYRMGLPGENKKYKSVVSTIAIVDEIIENIGSEENLLSLCQNRSVFSVDELKEFWRKHRYNLKILKFIFVKSLSKRLTLGYLWEHNIIAAPGGPRPFTPITDEQFDMIVKDSETEITYVE
jgi:predicted nucleic acid-binding protein